MTQTSFRATKGGLNQSGVPDNTATQITFGTEVFDFGSRFASNLWTPPPGLVVVGAAVRWTGTISSGSFTSLEIRKNGVTVIGDQQQKNFTNTGGDYCVGYDQATGSDTYGVWAQIDVSSSTATISGTVEDSYFFGMLMGNFDPGSFMNVSNTVTMTRRLETIGY